MAIQNSDQQKVKRKILEETLAKRHIDNKYSLELITCGENDPTPIVRGGDHEMEKHGLDILRSKYVCLLVSDLDIPNGVITILHYIYMESKQEIVWVPIVDRRSSPWNEAKEAQFKLVKGTMPWYSVSHPSKIDEAVYGYVKEVWGFTQKPLLAVVDPQGKLTNVNALPMILIWGSVAFPFTKWREEALWDETTWSMSLLVDPIHYQFLDWMKNGKYICLYGGEDMDWIRKLTMRIRYVAQEAGIVPLEMMYVGKMNVINYDRMSGIIQAENLSSSLEDPTVIWFFWERLESMRYLKEQNTNNKPYSMDPILQEVREILSYDRNNQCWAVFSRGDAEMTKGEGSDLVKVLDKFDSWKHEVIDVNGFILALDDQLRRLSYTKGTCAGRRMVVVPPAPGGRCPETMSCVECGQAMHKFYVYTCCLQDND